MAGCKGRAGGGQGVWDGAARCEPGETGREGGERRRRGRDVGRAGGAAARRAERAGGQLMLWPVKTRLASAPLLSSTRIFNPACRGETGG